VPHQKVILITHPLPPPSLSLSFFHFELIHSSSLTSLTFDLPYPHISTLTLLLPSPFVQLSLFLSLSLSTCLPAYHLLPIHCTSFEFKSTICPSTSLSKVANRSPFSGQSPLTFGHHSSFLRTSACSFTHDQLCTNFLNSSRIFSS
jgi:hypothetical protein